METAPFMVNTWTEFSDSCFTMLMIFYPLWFITINQNKSQINPRFFCVFTAHENKKKWKDL